MAKQRTLFDAVQEKKEIVKLKKEKEDQSEIRKADLEAQKKQLYATL